MKLTFERLCAVLSERAACRTMVELLALAHERACEATLAVILDQCITDDVLPDLVELRGRFAPDPATLPVVTVQLAPLASYDVLLTGAAA